MRKKMFPKVRKDIKDFLISEEGRVSEKQIARVALLLIYMSLMASPDQAMAQHSNYMFTSGTGGHVSHTSHASHGSHASHNNGIVIAVTAATAIGFVAAI